jgi:CBS-domain-containing membrane protein
MRTSPLPWVKHYSSDQKYAIYLCLLPSTDSCYLRLTTNNDQEFPGIYTCSLNDRLNTIFETISKSRVHRFVVIDEHSRLEGVLTLGDILEYILLEGEESEQ